jgi:hypothetical protein
VCIRTVGVQATLIYWASANPTWAGCIMVSIFSNMIEEIMDDFSVYEKLLMIVLKI